MLEEDEYKNINTVANITPIVYEVERSKLLVELNKSRIKSMNIKNNKILI